jgi:hypothetical protein
MDENGSQYNFCFLVYSHVDHAEVADQVACQADATMKGDQLSTRTDALQIAVYSHAARGSFPLGSIVAFRDTLEVADLYGRLVSHPRLAARKVIAFLQYGIGLDITRVRF